MKHLLAARDVCEAEAWASRLVRLGGPRDAAQAADAFLAAVDRFPENDLIPLLEVVAAHGGHAEGAKLYAWVTEKGLADNSRLDEIRMQELVGEVLITLARLEFSAAIPLIADTAFECQKWQLQYDAVLGLLHLDCAEYQDRIIRGIQACYGHSIFPEAMPALVCKVIDKDVQAQMLHELYELGTFCSLDCNSGIVEGFARSGAAGRPYFKAALYDPFWECDEGGTGTLWASYQGLDLQGLTFAEIIYDLHAMTDPAQRRHVTSLLVALLKQRAHDVTGTHIENFLELHRLLDDDSLHQELREVQQELCEAQRLIELRMRLLVMDPSSDPAVISGYSERF